MKSKYLLLIPLLIPTIIKAQTILIASDKDIANFEKIVKEKSLLENKIQKETQQKIKETKIKQISTNPKQIKKQKKYSHQNTHQNMFQYEQQEQNKMRYQNRINQSQNIRDFRKYTTSDTNTTLEEGTRRK